jgi:pimeloyl-ACP methyl ester carboxylesterase
MSAVMSEFVDVAGGYLYHEQQGVGPDVVLINGGLSDLRMWDSTVSWLAETARVTTWDCRDTGLSSWATEPYDEMDDLAAVLDAAGSRGPRWSACRTVADGPWLSRIAIPSGWIGSV